MTRCFVAGCKRIARYRWIGNCKLCPAHVKQFTHEERR